MYVEIERHVTGVADGPRVLLESCHRRIRSFTNLSLRLIEVTEPDPEQISEAARAVLRYFDEALPKHVADEEESLEPRLRDVVGAQLALMQEQHRRIEKTLALLLPLWRALSQSPDALTELGPLLSVPTRQFATLWEPHLSLEEREIFPALAALPTEEVAAIWREMRGRRTARPHQA